MKRNVEVWDYAGRILRVLGNGALLTTKADGKVNTMTIGWGTLGIEWGKPIFVAYVRESRYTRELLEKNPEFTVNIPFGECDKGILGVCGTKSGRDMDKIEALGLELEEGRTVSVPGIRQLPLTLECKVIYTQLQDESKIRREAAERYYPRNEAGKADNHFAFYGLITDAYIIE